ncbi:MAG: substrate-binding domain-containing protein [Prevotella sp.]
MNPKLTTFALTLLALLALLLSACSTKKSYFIGVSQCSEDSWRTKMNSEIRRESYLYDNVRVEFASAKDDNRVQIAQIERFIEQGADLIIVSPNEAKALTPVINKAFDRGVRVVLVDRKSASDKYTAFIGADNVAIGRAVGRFVGEHLGGKGHVMELQGLRGSSPAMERDSGFREALAHYPQIKVVANAYADWFAQKAETEAERMFKDVGGADLVFAQCDRMGIGAHQATQKLGIKGVKIVGVDALPTPGDGIEAVKNGTFLATFVYPTHGDEVLKLAMNILEGRPFQRETILKTGVIDAANAESALQQWAELTLLDNKMQRLNHRIDESLAQYSNQKTILVLGVLLVLILMVFAFVVLKAYFAKVKLNEQLEEKNREIEAATQAKLMFFTNVSHELRTPLTLIETPVEQLLAENQLSKVQRRLLEVAHRNVRTLLKLINQILDFRKVEGGKMTLQLAETNLAALVGNVVSEFVAAAEHKRIRLSCRLPEHISATIDAGKVERVVSNILSNAVKFTPVAGEINVELVVDTPQDTATLSVTNTGKGIAESDLPHIFERFYQPQHSEGGTGIGLALAKAFVDMHGGHIGVSSKAEGPTVFTVHLPLNLQAETPTSAAEQSAIVEPQAFIVPATQATTKADAPQLQTIFEENNDPNQPTILFTDDNDDVCQMARTLLETHYRVLTAPNGVVALQMAELNIPDLVVSDVMMPQMNGLELCSRLKQSTATSHIPVILLTAQTLDEQRIAGYEHGADAYITKPFSAPLLLARIHNLLQSRKQLKQVFGGADELAKEEISTPDKEFVSKIRGEIHRNISNNDFGVEQLGAAVDLSRVQLYRKVKALTGLSPVELIRATRVNRARKLIEGGATSVSEVAYQVGFTSPSYFTKCFKDQFGVSPMELLK